MSIDEEWLEELEELRATSCGYSKEDIELNRNAMYNKAIDDFVQVVKKHDWNIRNRNENEFIYGAIDILAEQLKEGVKNET